MYKFLVLLLTACLLGGCSLIQPVYLAIENRSDYTVTVTIDQGLKQTLVLEKNKGDFTLVPPGPLLVTFEIDEIGYQKEYRLTPGYLEKQKISFSL